MNLPQSILTALLLTLSQTGMAQEPSWYEANRMQIQIADDESSVAWTFAFSNEGDMSVDIDQKTGQILKQGQIILVEGESLLTKDLALKKGSEIDALDGPALQYQLITQLLAHAFPNGPVELSGTQTSEKTEAIQGIQVGTSSASGVYEAPWSLKAASEKVTEQRINYSLTFTYQSEGVDQTVPISGYWEISSQAPGFDNNLDISDWAFYALGPFIVENQGGMILDYGATEQELTFETLGALKQHIREKAPR